MKRREGSVIDVQPIVPRLTGYLPFATMALDATMPAPPDTRECRVSFHRHILVRKCNKFSGSFSPPRSSDCFGT